MVNHVRTLLFNANSAEAEACGAPYVDPSFVPQTLSGNVLAAMRTLFGDERPAGRLRTVDFCMDFATSPEFDGFFSRFDRRICAEQDEKDVKYSTVAAFYGSLDKDFDTRIVEELISSYNTQFLFQHVGDVATDSALDSLHAIFAGSTETAKRFAAALFALVFRLDHQYSPR